MAVAGVAPTTSVPPVGLVTRIVDDMPRMSYSSSRLQCGAAREESSQLLRSIGGAHHDTGEGRERCRKSRGEAGNEIRQRHEKPLSCATLEQLADRG